MKKTVKTILILTLAVLLTLSVSAKTGNIGKFTPVIDGDKDAAYDKSFSYGIFEQEEVTPGEGFYSTYGDTETKSDARAYYLWDDKFLYVFVEVKDNTLTDAGSDYVLDVDNPWESEAVELWCLFEDLDDGSLFNKTSIELFSNRFWGEGANFDDMVALGSKAIAKKTATGYNAEFALAIPGGLKDGQQIKVTLQVNDFSADGTNAIGKQINANNTDELIVLVLGAEIAAEKAPAPEPKPEPEPEKIPETPAPVIDVPVVTPAPAPAAPRTGDLTILLSVISMLGASGMLVAKNKKRS